MAGEDKASDPSKINTVKGVMTFVEPLFAQITDQLAQLQASMDSVKTHLTGQGTKIDGAVTAIDDIKQRFDGIVTSVGEVKASLEFTQNQVSDITNRVIPAVADHFADVQVAAVTKTLEQDVWNRKRNVLVTGIDGDAGESEEETKAKICDWAKVTLGVDTHPDHVAAAHRLNSTKAKAGIIVRFIHFPEAEKWASAAARRGADLKAKRISVVVDLPPCLRTVRKELLDKRAAVIAADPTKKGHIKLLPHFPFVQLVTQKRVAVGTPRDQLPPRVIVDHEWCRAKLAAEYLGVPSIRCTVVKSVEEIQLAGLGFRPGPPAAAAAPAANG